MAKFKKGDKVSWNSEAGHVQGTIIAVKSSPFTLEGKTGKKYTRHATKANPQYAIKSNKSNHVAHHFGSALHKVK